MKYFKILNNTEFIGIITSANFVAENPISKWVASSDENHGQFVEFEEHLYRDYWMQPIIDSTREFIIAQIVEISQEEYNTLADAIKNNETIIIEDEDEDDIQPVVIPSEPDITVEYVKSGKIKEMSTTCRTIIEAGFDIMLRGENHHFSLDTQDQLNLISLSAMAQTQELIPYHADGEMCIFYTAEEMNQIIETATRFKIYHTTYYNALKGYINALDNIADIAAITYGIAIPEEYQSDVLKALDV